MNLVENIANILKIVNRKSFINAYALPQTNKKVAKLREVERVVKDSYKIDTKVIYISSKHKKLLINDAVRGYYNTKDDYAVVFVNDDYKQNVNTLCHELTHAYQNKHMHSKYIASTKALKEGRVSYAKAWHEVHAKTEANIMCNYFLSRVA